MIDHTPVRLIFIRTCIVLLQNAPWIEAGLLCTVPLVLPKGSPLLPILTIFLTALLILESLFSVFIYLPHKTRLERVADYPPPLSPQEREALFERCAANIPSLERYLRVWFLGADPAEIKRDNVRDFILWAFFDSDGDNPAAYLGHASEGFQEEVDFYIHRIETLLGRQLPPGRGTATPLRLTIDPISTRYHSIIWYAIIGLLDITTHIQLRYHRFKYYGPNTTLPNNKPNTKPLLNPTSTFPPTLLHTLPFLRARLLTSPSSLPYWYRPHRSPHQRPILFVHGIGIGLHPYIPFLTSPHLQDIGIIALSLLPISSRLTNPPLPREAFLSELSTILSAHEPAFQKFTLVSHSYGSVLTTHILRSPVLSPRVEAVVLIDPVSLLLHLPDVAYNFTRRPPRKANEYQLWYFASMDLGVAGALGRHFFWRENIIWKEELVHVHGAEGPRRKAVVCLSGRDLIVDAESVARYLLTVGEFGKEGGKGEVGFDAGVDQTLVGKEGFEVVWFAEMDHSQVFEKARERDRVVEVVRRCCEIG
jgi:pimeloyl-ACP methyl ester carboxylesterase